MKQRPPLEINLLFKWAKYHEKEIDQLKTLHHIPSSVRKGTPNVFWAYSNGIHHGLYLYILTKDIDLSYSQTNWINSLVSIGYAVRICKNHLEAKQMILEYYNTKLIT